MKAIFVTKFPPSEHLPPMQSDSGDQLHFDDGGVLRGGYACIGHVPRVDKTDTCLVWVEASQAVLQSMKGKAKYLFLALLNDEEAPTLATKTYLKDWFAAHPVYEEKVLSVGIDNVPELLRKICEWHGVDIKDLKTVVGLS